MLYLMMLMFEQESDKVSLVQFLGNGKAVNGNRT